MEELRKIKVGCTQQILQEITTENPNVGDSVSAEPFGCVNESTDSAIKRNVVLTPHSAAGTLEEWERGTKESVLDVLSTLENVESRSPLNSRLCINLQKDTSISISKFQSF